MYYIRRNNSFFPLLDSSKGKRLLLRELPFAWESHAQTRLAESYFVRLIFLHLGPPIPGLHIDILDR